MRLRLLGTLALALALAGTAWAQEPKTEPKRGPEPGEKDHKHHDPPSRPSQEQIDKRLERIKKRAEERRKNRAQRMKDRRKAMRRQLHKLLDGGPIPAEVKGELEAHARRTAQLRRIRDLAAEKADYDAVERADKLLARENARHDSFMRGVRKKLKAQAAEAGTP